MRLPRKEGGLRRGVPKGTEATAQECCASATSEAANAVVKEGAQAVGLRSFGPVALKVLQWELDPESEPCSAK